MVLTLWPKEKDEREKDITSDEKNSKRKQVKTQKTVGKIKVKRTGKIRKKRERWERKGYNEWAKNLEIEQAETTKK